MYEFDEYVIDVLLRDLTGHDRRPTSFLVYLWLAAAETRNGSPVAISYQELAENVGISKSSAQLAVGWLVRRKLLSVRKGSITATPVYTVLRTWKRERKN